MNPTSNLTELANQIKNGQAISRSQAKELVDIPRGRLYELFHNANLIRLHFRGTKVGLCAITNAKSGACSENCAFCAQSGHNPTGVDVYPLLETEELLRRAKLAAKTGTDHFCIVTSGRRINSEQEFQRICEAVTRIKEELGFLVDASLGELTLDEAKELKRAGLRRYNHNLETSINFFPQVCTTHGFKDRVRTIANVKSAGIEICSGGIFGLGETDADRLDMAFILKALGVDCVPLNFFNPVNNTRAAAKAKAVHPLELLRWVAIYRFILPDKEIKICGGRQTGLGEYEPLLFVAGADAVIVGDYLTTKGSSVNEDLSLIQELGLTVN